MKSLLINCLSVLILVNTAFAQSTTQAIVPSGTQPAINPVIDITLDLLHDRGTDLREFSADVKLAETDATTGDTISRIGKVLYQTRNDAGSRIRVTFSQKIVEGKPPRDEKLEYLLQEGWLIDRDFRRKVETRRQVLRPGEKINLLKLGEGPFPLPIGQDKADVHAQFDVCRLDLIEGEPKGTEHLQLIPKKDTRFARKFRLLDIWVDQSSRMPVRIDTVDINEAISRSTELTNVNVNPTPPMKDSDFTLDSIKDQGWTEHEEPFAD